MEKRITLQDVAKAGGVSVITVSRSLSGKQRVSAATRARIRELADRMGYQPDPALSVLVAYRSKTNAKAYHETLGFIGDVAISSQSYEDLKAGSRSHGFVVDPFPSPANRREAEALARQLRARGIRGVLLHSSFDPALAEVFHPARFTVFSLAAESPTGSFHSVSYNHYHATHAALHRLKSLGYGRVGLVSAPREAARTEFQSETAFRYWADPDGLLVTAGTFRPKAERWRDDRFLKWIRDSRLDALIVGTDDWILKTLDKIHVKVPETLGVLSLARPGESRISGMRKEPRTIHRIALKLLASMLLYGRFGDETKPFCLRLEAEWVDGETLRRQPGGQAS